jgi:hypothetical protein
MIIHPYATKAYAGSLAHWGKAFDVPEWGTHVIIRTISGDAADAFGTYPIAILHQANDLQAGLERLRQAGLVAVTLVLDDFHRPTLDDLNRYFDMVRPFKTHSIHRTGSPFTYNKHHRYEVARARKKVTVRSFDLREHLDEWMRLYATLISRHTLSGVHDFSKAHYAVLAEMAGVTAVGAWLEDKLVSAHLWVSDGTHVHSHLAASSEAGYKVGAAYAVYDESIKIFSDATLINLGGGAGTGNDSVDGLARFKQGFANDEASAYISGTILNKARYEALSQAHGATNNADFFPAYRAPRI